MALSSNGRRIGFAIGFGWFALDLRLDARMRDVLSWMDPYQYYDFALGVVQARESFNGFEIPSIFPFLLMPLLALDASIPTALWISLGAAVLLAVGVDALCRELAVETPSPWVTLIVLCSPLLIGLSRTLYVEFTLTALATLCFVAWLRLCAKPGAGRGLTFALLFGAGFMTKTTFWLFLLAPVAAAVVGRAAERRSREAALLAASAIAPIGIALAIHVFVFPSSLGYYANLVSTEQPFMYLMGPPDAASWDSVAYYFGEVGRTFLFGLTPLLVFAAIDLARRSRRPSWRDLADPRTALWLWFVAPLMLLIAHPLKEPRHVAPSVVPAVLLLVLGIESLRGRGARRAVMVLAVSIAIAQWAAISLHIVQTPYFMDRSLHYGQIRAQLLAADARPLYDAAPDALRGLHWNYNQNVAISGFDANEALALTWQGFPGVTYDLDVLDDADRSSDRIAFERFEDLFFLAGINTYNRRCGWRSYHTTLTVETVIANADWLLVNAPDAAATARRFPDHEHIATIEREAGAAIQILRAAGPTLPYRSLYARRFLARNPAPGPEVELSIAREILMAAVLDADAAAVHAIAREFPILRRSDLEARNIYWIAGYPALIQYAQQRFTRLR